MPLRRKWKDEEQKKRYEDSTLETVKQVEKLQQMIDGLPDIEQDTKVVKKMSDTLMQLRSLLRRQEDITNLSREQAENLVKEMVGMVRMFDMFIEIEKKSRGGGGGGGDSRT